MLKVVSGRLLAFRSGSRCHYVGLVSGLDLSWKLLMSVKCQVKQLTAKFSSSSLPTFFSIKLFFLIRLKVV